MTTEATTGIELYKDAVLRPIEAPSRSSGLVLHHINGDPMDNRDENLERMPASENLRRAEAMPLCIDGPKEGG